MSHLLSSAEMPCVPPSSTSQRALDALFDSPGCRVPTVALPDDTPIVHGQVEPVLLGLLRDDPAMRVCTLQVPVSDDPWASGEWTCVGSTQRARALFEVPLVVSRSRGAWTVGWTRGGNLAWATAQAVELRVWLVEQLCWQLGWRPEHVPLGAAALAVGCDVESHTTHALPTRDVIGRSQLPELARHLWRIPTGVPERRRRQVTSATIARFFEDLTRLGTLVRADDALDAVELPGWMLRR